MSLTKKLVLIIIFISLGVLLYSEKANLQEKSLGKKHPSVKKIEGKICLKCHSNIMGKKNQHSIFKISDCDACHLITKDKEGTKVLLININKKELCLSCHQKMAVPFGITSIHFPMNDCTLCHNPHSSNNEKLLLKETPELCYDCHKEIKNNVFGKYKHSAIEMGCLSCHNPHFSSNYKLLTEPFNKICTNCHDYRDKSIINKHASVNLEIAKCSECHNPHGAEKEKLLKANFIHTPVEQAACDNCHIKSEKEIKLIKNDYSLCLNCHSEFEEGLKEKSVHLPIKSQCISCHNPHLSNFKKLLTKKAEELCSDCHRKEQEKLNEIHYYQLIDNKCLECHNPHYSKRTKLILTDNIHKPFEVGKCKQCHLKPKRNKTRLFYAGNILCYSCHEIYEKDYKYKHLPVSQNCVNCHLPHISKEKKLLKEPAPRLCFDCHKEKEIFSNHNNISLANSNCSSCHEIHGGFSKYLLKNASIHPPFEEKNCYLCHKENKEKIELTDNINNLCSQCHQDIKEETHLKFSHKAIKQGCNKCHNPHLSSEKKLLPFPEAELCQSCHTLDKLLLSKHYNQNIAGTKCSKCHNPHGSSNAALIKEKNQHLPFAERQCEACHQTPKEGEVFKLISEGNSLCLTCHSDFEDVNKSKFAHSAISIKGCSSCHNAHFGKEKFMLPELGKNLCLSCHKNIQSLLNKNIVHKATEDCKNCHQTHSGKFAYLLNSKINELCLKCHKLATSLLNSHNNQPIEQGNCLNCHNPHGSNSGKLIADNQHPPFEERECNSCHSEPKNNEIILNDNLNGLCFTCHSEIQESLNKAVIKHPPAIEKCTNCHSPHASNYNKLVLKNTFALCSECHKKEKEAYDKAKFKHKVIEEIGCQACHNPHSSNQKSLLNASINEVCLNCHYERYEDVKEKVTMSLEVFNKIPKISLSYDRTRNHPTINHPVSSEFTIRNQKINLSCISCHNPHQSEAPKLLVAGIFSRTELCLKCH